MAFWAAGSIQTLGDFGWPEWVLGSCLGCALFKLFFGLEWFQWLLCDLDGFLAGILCMGCEIWKSSWPGSSVWDMCFWLCVIWMGSSVWVVRFGWVPGWILLYGLWNSFGYVWIWLVPGWGSLYDFVIWLGYVLFGQVPGGVLTSFVICFTRFCEWALLYLNGIQPGAHTFCLVLCDLNFLHLPERCSWEGFPGSPGHWWCMTRAWIQAHSR